MPMHGTPIYDAEGRVIGIACSRQPRRKACASCRSFEAGLECDGCDRALCGMCAVSPRKGVDFCPACFQPAFDHWKALPGTQAHSVAGVSGETWRANRRAAFRAWARLHSEEFMRRSKPMTTAGQRAAKGTRHD